MIPLFNTEKRLLPQEEYAWKIFQVHVYEYCAFQAVELQQLCQRSVDLRKSAEKARAVHIKAEVKVASLVAKDRSSDVKIEAKNEAKRAEAVQAEEEAVDCMKRRVREYLRFTRGFLGHSVPYEASERAQILTDGCGALAAATLMRADSLRASTDHIFSKLSVCPELHPLPFSLQESATSQPEDGPQWSAIRSTGDGLQWSAIRSFALANNSLECSGQLPLRTFKPKVSQSETTLSASGSIPSCPVSQTETGESRPVSRPEQVIEGEKKDDTKSQLEAAGLDSLVESQTESQPEAAGEEANDVVDAGPQPPMDQPEHEKEPVILLQQPHSGETTTEGAVELNTEGPNEGPNSVGAEEPASATSMDQSNKTNLTDDDDDDAASSDWAGAGIKAPGFDYDESAPKAASFGLFDSPDITPKTDSSGTAEMLSGEGETDSTNLSATSDSSPKRATVLRDSEISV
uniref:Uncharacterized protein n=2 Tax=Octactis speculum TaxID=3111310 RepID=A0A7S2E4P7_9STRA